MGMALGSVEMVAAGFGSTELAGIALGSVQVWAAPTTRLEISRIEVAKTI